MAIYLTLNAAARVSKRRNYYLIVIELIATVLRCDHSRLADKESSENERAGRKREGGERERKREMDRIRVLKARGIEKCWKLDIQFVRSRAIAVLEISCSPLRSTLHLLLPTEIADKSTDKTCV